MSVIMAFCSRSLLVKVPSSQDDRKKIFKTLPDTWHHEISLKKLNFKERNINIIRSLEPIKFIDILRTF